MLQRNKKIKKESEELVGRLIQEKNPFQNVELDDIWIKDDLYDSNDPRSIAETSKKIIDEVMPSSLIDLNVPTPPDTDDEIDNDIDFTISDSQLVEGNDISVDRETESFINFTVTDSRVNDSVETEPFVDFNINDSRVVRVVDTEDGIETINITTDDDTMIPDINTIGRDAGPPKHKKLVTTHLTQAVRAANKIKKKYEKKEDW